MTYQMFFLRKYFPKMIFKKTLQIAFKKSRFYKLRPKIIAQVILEIIGQKIALKYFYIIYNLYVIILSRDI